MSRTPTSSVDKPRIVAVVGPTATGKTRLAVSLAERFDSEIINADSRQVYRGMDIGTAKPTAHDMASAPHHLVDLFDASEDFGLGVFLDLARRAAGQIVARGRLPIIAGGTGQYVWSFLEGKAVPRVAPDPEFRRALERQATAGGGEILQRKLQELDPERAAMLDPRNVRRVIRALEIHHATGRKPSEILNESIVPYRALVIGLTMDRKALYRRIDERVDRMMSDGLLDEVERLETSGFLSGQGPLSSPGYRELGLHLNGLLDLKEAVRQTKTKTHRLARRQYNWFKPTDPRICWLDAADIGVEQTAARLVSSFLSVDSAVIQ